MPLNDLVNTYHTYIFGTSFWYFLRGLARIIDPLAVISWFRPPVLNHLEPNDLEVYTIWTDAWGLLTIAALVVVMADAVPLPKGFVGSLLSDAVPTEYKKPYARAAVVITIFHHVTTMIGAFEHWILPSHHTLAMDIGVYGNIFLTVLGVAALVFGLKDDETKPVKAKRGAQVVAGSEDSGRYIQPKAWFACC